MLVVNCQLVAFDCWISSYHCIQYVTFNHGLTSIQLKLIGCSNEGSVVVFLSKKCLFSLVTSGSAQNSGTLTNWYLKMYGTAEPSQPTDFTKKAISACSIECLDGCTGPRPDQCNECKHFKSSTNNVCIDSLCQTEFCKTYPFVEKFVRVLLSFYFYKLYSMTQKSLSNTKLILHNLKT